MRDLPTPASIRDATGRGRSLRERPIGCFAGAGISTESRAVLQQTLYDQLAAELDVKDDALSFPELMSRFQQDKGRRLLLQRIKERFDYVDDFPELRRIATRFQQELSTLFYVEDIITTNWDTYFEDVAQALPLVSDKDFGLSDLPGRKVLKIHGSIHNPGSIIATENDYRRCYRSLNRSVLGGTLKHLLATKTPLFVGYSFRDPDFNRIWRFMEREMSDLLPRAVVVTLDQRPSTVKSARTITTDAAYFIQVLKTHLLPRGCLLPDGRWDAIVQTLVDIEFRHAELYEKLNLQRVPAAVLCGHYQDGLIHAFERMLARHGSGEYSHVHRVEHVLRDYAELRTTRVRARRYHDVAYIDGYQNGLLFLIADDVERRALPLYYVYGGSDDLRSLTAFRREAVRAEALHRSAYKQARRIARQWSPGIIPHHRPEL